MPTINIKRPSVAREALIIDILANALRDIREKYARERDPSASAVLAQAAIEMYERLDAGGFIDQARRFCDQSHPTTKRPSWTRVGPWPPTEGP